MTDRYIDATNGNDSTGAGTLAAPWQTTGKGVGSAVAGDQLIFRGGATSGAAVVYKGSYINKNITIKNYPNEHVNFSDPTRAQVISFDLCTAGGIVVQGSGSIRVGDPRTPVSSNDTITGEAAMQLAGCSGMVFDGGPSIALKIESFADFGIRTTSNGSTQTKNCTFRYLDITHNGIGIRVSGEGTSTVAPTGGSGVLIDNCHIHHNDRMVVRTPSPTNDDFGALGVDLYKCTGVTVQNCEIDNNFSTVAANGSPPSLDYGVDGGAVETFGSTYCKILNNRIHDNEGIWEMGTSSTLAIPTGNVFRYNLCYGTIDPLPALSGTDSPGILARSFQNGAIEHNVFDIDGGSDVIRIDNSGAGWAGGVIWTGGSIRNNIIVARGATQQAIYIQQAQQASFVLDYNLIWQATANAQLAKVQGYGSTFTTGTLATFQAATPFGDHDIWNVDPLFINRATRDYHVPANSPAVNAGVVIAGVNNGYLGTAPDIGAFEFVTSGGGTSTVTDSFNRTTASGWGTSDQGGTWTVLGSGGGVPADFSTDGAAGKMVGSTTSTTHNAQLALATRSADAVVRLWFDKIAAADKHAAAIDLRFIDTSNMYRAYLWADQGGSAIQAKITRVAGGVSTDIAPRTSVPGVTQTINRVFKLRFEAEYTPVGPNGESEFTTLRLRIWQEGQAEPTSWFQSVVDTTAALQVAGNVRLRAEVGALSTAGTVTTYFDDLLVVVIPDGVPEGTPPPPPPPPPPPGTPPPPSTPPGPLTTLVYDSGWITSSATEHTLPPGKLKNAKSYRWTVDVEDTDSLGATVP